MPLALLIIGILVVISGIKNNAPSLGAALVTDFKGSGSFFYWVVGVVAVGSLGYNPKLKTVSHLFLLLIAIVFVVSNNGFFQQFQAALQNPVPASPNNAAAPNMVVPASPKNGFPGLTDEGIPSLKQLETLDPILTPEMPGGN